MSFLETRLSFLDIPKIFGGKLRLGQKCVGPPLILESADAAIKLALLADRDTLAGGWIFIVQNRFLHIYMDHHMS